MAQGPLGVASGVAEPQTLGAGLSLPLVMPSNLVKRTKGLDEKHPGRVGILCSVDGWADPKGLPYALDNGRFPVWSAGKAWREDAFWSLLDRARRTYPPRWVAVPDVVCDGEATLKEWRFWHPALAKEGWPLALVVQNGMRPRDILEVRPLPDVIFVGGTTGWKWEWLRSWCGTFPRVHVGRVNTERMLWQVQKAGAESSDGTGWWHHKQFQGLLRYLERSGKGLSQYDREIRGFLE